MPKQETYQRLFGSQQNGAVKQNLLVILAVAMSILTFAWYMLPQGYSTDTTLIGKGKPTVVLIYDPENMASDALMDSFNQVRGEFKGEVEFIIVDVNAPGGRQFANANAVATASALFFSHRGDRVAIIYSPQAAAVLKKMIRQSFGL